MGTYHVPCNTQTNQIKEENIGGKFIELVKLKLCT